MPRLPAYILPFTERSLEIDFNCHNYRGDGCRVYKQSYWIEITGSAMVEPRVFERAGYNPKNGS